MEVAIMRNRPIIIVGGMGPQASLELHRRILAKSREHHNGNPDEYPEIIHLSLRVPEFFGSSKNENEAVHIINQHLDNLTIPDNALICMPCNTAHKLARRLHFGKAEFVSMVDAVQAAVANQDSTRVGLLASPNTLESLFYDKVLHRTGKDILHPQTSDLPKLQVIIAAVLANNSSATTKQMFNRVATNLKDAGAETLLLGCTELPLIGLDTDLPIIDSLDVLTDALIEREYCYNESKT
jgi:aspartate racemase